MRLLAAVPLATWWPVGAVLLTAGLVAVGTAVRGRAHRGRRTALALLSVLAVLASAGVGVNAYFGYFRTLAEAVGAPPPHETTLARVRAKAGARAGHGTVVTLPVPGTVSGFAAQPAQVYLPPAWSAPRQAPLPVVVLLHGTPGDPTDWVEGGQAQATADAWAAQHRGVAPVLVMPDVNGSFTGDTECVDSPRGNVETYLTVDLPAALRTLGTQPPGSAWAIAGLSEGGTCAIVLALRHPDLFAAFADFSGLAGPRVGETNADTADTVTELFGGSPQAFAAHEPVDLLAGTRFPRTGGWFQVGALDAEPLAAAQQLAPLASAAGITTCLVVMPDGEHTFDVWSAALRDAFPWLAQRTGLVPPGTASCPAPAPVPAE